MLSSKYDLIEQDLILQDHFKIISLKRTDRRTGRKDRHGSTLMYIPNDGIQNYLFCRLQLVVETFGNSTK